jgi:DNA-binding response OmpR family regulator
MRVLVVEDEPKMLDLLRDGLREHGHSAITARDGLDGLELAQGHVFDVILLDLRMPKMNGWEVMRQLRRSENAASVLMLTACDSEREVIDGLEAGADDYLTKPFSFAELLARIKSLGRAQSAGPNDTVTVDTLAVNLLRHTATRANHALDLTRTEFALLDCLARHSGRTVSRLTLLETVWGNDSPVSRSALDSFISLLRKKVDLPAERKLVHTVKGVGYMIGIRHNETSEISGERV